MKRWRGVCLALLLVPAGCRTTTPPPPVFTPEQLAAAAARLRRPLAGDLAALYRLRVPSAGGMRLSILTRGEAGRLSINGSFGSAYSLAAWSADAPPLLFDFRQGCRVEAADVSASLGITNLPMPQAVRLLAGRLPAVGSDTVTPLADGRLLVEGDGWACMVSVRQQPWRVVAVEEAALLAGRGWHINLEDHTLSLPGRLRLEHPQKRWVELDLISLQWNVDAGVSELPELPDLPPCSTLPREDR